MLERIKSNIRFSLSLRIATRYALFLLGSMFWATLVFTLAYAATILPAYIEQGKEIIAAYEETGGAGRNAARNSELLSVRIESPDGAVVYDGLNEDDFLLFRIADKILYIRITLHDNNGTAYTFVASAAPYQRQYLIFTAHARGAGYPPASCR